MPASLGQPTCIYQNHHLDSTRWNAYEPRVGDIVIATSYKSGTTWTQEIVLHLIYQGQALPVRSEVSPWLDARWSPLDELITNLEGQSQRRFIKTHLPLDGLPFFPQVNYIVVGRDPRDVFMSLWNHYSNYTEEYYSRVNDTPGRVGAPLPPCPQNIHDFWQGWITQGWFEWETEGYPFWGNMHHTQSWWNYRGLENILFVHFNDLLAGLQGEIRRIADFLAIEASDETIARIAQAVDLTTMRKKAEALNHFKSWKEGAKGFFFKGTNGRWREALSPAELALYEDTAAKVLAPECARWLARGRIALEPLS